jgi:hypothetical protein
VNGYPVPPTPVSEPDKLAIEKNKAEIDKLRAEVESLKALDPFTREATAWLTPAGTVIGAIVGGFITLAITKMGQKFATVQGERGEQDTKDLTRN